MNNRVMFLRRSIFSGIVISTLMLMSAPGRGDPTEKSPYERLSAEAKSVIQRHHEKALQLFAVKDYASALKEVQKIHKLAPDYRDAHEIERYSKEGLENQKLASMPLKVRDRLPIRAKCDLTELSGDRESDELTLPKLKTGSHCYSPSSRSSNGETSKNSIRICLTPREPEGATVSIEETAPAKTGRQYLQFIESPKDSIRSKSGKLQFVISKLTGPKSVHLKVDDWEAEISLSCQVPKD